MQEETELERYKAALKRIIDLEGEWTPVPDETTGKPISDLEYGRWLGLCEAMHVAIRALFPVNLTRA
jgi:hypothetical protein